ncbi:hypothetical protein M441DRAFT_126176 [Trichoderma asperellum CBS 433.97]|uniref:Thioredoxin domain-containing protein n=2 Tax=Trichoderma asperellum TaxID=101201 RepID=A0A2T3ZNE2_TRIA4|nr:hypothetical protein M441DRAFT_126176 [Trichoderma asperellum CBS 433.97]PTB46308.1 hypothetical protein M441DRAFT_126176 [Trichoderma asperellum CBS 433.97]
MVRQSLSSVLVQCGLLASCANMVCASEFSGATEVKKLLAHNEYTLLACNKKLLKEWKTVEKNVASTATIDCAAASGFCHEMDVVSLPAIRLYQKDGPTTRYRGPRRASPIEAFVKRALRPSVQDIAKQQQLDDFLTSDDYVFLAQLHSDDKSLDARFRNLAEEFYDRYSFGMASAADASSSGIWCYNNVDESEHTATDLDDADALKKLVDVCTAEVIPQLTRRNELTHLSSGRSLVYYLSKNEAHRQAYTKNLKSTAQQYAQFLTFVTVDSNEYPDLARNLGIRSTGGLAVQNVHNGQVFPFKGDTTSSHQIGQFIVAISEGKAEPWDGTYNEGHDEL